MVDYLRCLGQAVLLVVACSICSCGSPTAEGYRRDGQDRMMAVTKELRLIKTRQQLIDAQEVLKAHFDALVELMIRSRELQFNQKRTQEFSTPLDDEINIALQSQLQRVCRIPGGLELIEKCQEAALHRLDHFEKGLHDRRFNQKKRLIAQSGGLN